MKLLFLTHRLPYAPNRGDRIRAYHLLRTLARHVEIDLVSLVHNQEEATHAHDLDDIVRSTTVVRVPRVRNGARCGPALTGTTPLTHVFLGSPEVAPALQRLRATGRPDVVLAYCSGMAQFLFSDELRDIPAVLDMVDVDSAKWSDLADTASPPKSWIFRRESRVLRRFEARAAARAFATLTVNEREKKALLSIAPEARITTVPNGIDCEYFRPQGRPATEPVVVFCGVMNYAPNEQGICWFVENVWPRIQALRPDARLVIVGANPTPQINRLQQANGVTVTGAVPDVRPFLWNAAVAIAPIWISHGLQNKVLEAFAAGLPCIVTPPVAEGLPPQAARACVTAGDSSEFAAAVIEALAASSGQRRAAASKAGVEDLAWAAQLAEAVTIVKDAADHQSTDAQPLHVGIH